MSVPVICIDGPSGSGKGTLSYLLAKELDWHLLDSGALYRLLALAAERQGVDWSDETGLAELAVVLDVEFVPAEDEPTNHIRLDGDWVTDAIRTENCDKGASLVSAHPAVRTALLDRQRGFRTSPGLVADGRDMGTVVFSDAPLKFFLTASPEVRAERRYKQLKDKGFDVSLRALFEGIKARDLRDSSRGVSPLVAADDAVVLDSSEIGINEVFATVLQAARDKGLTA